MFLNCVDGVFNSWGVYESIRSSVRLCVHSRDLCEFRCSFLKIEVKAVEVLAVGSQGSRASEGPFTLKVAGQGSQGTPFHVEDRWSRQLRF